jgi:hypothetical protein
MKETVFALEVLATILKTGNPERVLDTVVEKLSREANKSFKDALLYKLFRKGKRKLAEKFMYLKQIYLEESPVDAFYRADLIDEDTYRFLLVVQNKGGLTANLIKILIDSIEERQKAMKETLFLLAMPLLYIFLASVIGVLFSSNFVDVLLNIVDRNSLPPLILPHLFIKEHPFIAFLIIFIVSLAAIFGLLFLLFKKAGYLQLKMYQLATIASILRRQNIPYSEIFSFLSSAERDKKLREIYTFLAEEVKKLPVAEAISDLLEMLPFSIALIFSSQLERGEEISGWEYLKEEMRKAFLLRLQTLKTVIPNIGFAILAIIILFSISPLFVAIKVLMKMLSGMH